MLDQAALDLIGDNFDGSEGEARAVSLKPVGPVAQSFVSDKRFVTAVMGPYGSGKTTTCFQKILNATLWQRPGRDGVRRSRGMVVRSTYGQLQTNVMADWFGWFPKQPGINWNDKEHKHTLKIDFPPFGMLEIEVLFRAVDQEDKPEKLFKGVNLTWGWLNEVDTLHPNIRSFLMPRLGRYPGTRDGGCHWSGLWADMNAPDIDNYTYNWLVEQDMGVDPELAEKLAAIYGPLWGIGFHRQPGGLDAAAENLMNLPTGYYERLAATSTANEKRRFVDNEFGAVRNGQPVYPEFIDAFHVGDVAPMNDRPALLALDGGTTPAAVLLQEADNGQVRVLDEIVVFANDAQSALERMGPKGFADVVRRHLDRNWPKLRLAREIACDPALFYGEYGDDLAWATDFATEFKGKLRAAPVKGNRITPRLEAVRGCLTTNVGGGPGMLVSPRAKVLRQGFNSAYVFTRVRTSSDSGRWKDEPDKTDHSHVHDALQYGVIWIKKRGIAADEADRVEAAESRKSKVHHSGYAAGAR
jgi:RecA/RadA recombinase